jgi:hypothetical protein
MLREGVWHKGIHHVKKALSALTCPNMMDLSALPPHQRMRSISHARLRRQFHSERMNEPIMTSSYSIPTEASKLLTTGIILNPLHQSAPAELLDAAKQVKFIGSALPSIPINWRFAESISALKGFQEAMLSVLLSRKN